MNGYSTNELIYGYIMSHSLVLLFSELTSLGKTLMNHLIALDHIQMPDKWNKEQTSCNSDY